MSTKQYFTKYKKMSERNIDKKSSVWYICKQKISIRYESDRKKD